MPKLTCSGLSLIPAQDSQKVTPNVAAREIQSHDEMTARTCTIANSGGSLLFKTITHLLFSLLMIGPWVVVDVEAQGDEIQVYDGSLAPVGVFNLTVHNNFTPNGIDRPAFPGAVTSDHSINGVPEWAYGVAPWFEAGLYLPLYSNDRALGWILDGFKLRALFAVPNAEDHRFFYGANFEFSINSKHWSTHRISSEVRPIIGWHLGRFDLIANPILDTDYDGIKNLEFAPSTRLAFNLTKHWAVSAEEYSEMGPLHGFVPAYAQSHQLFGVVDYVGAIELQVGAGYGLTEASDHLQLKVIFAKDLNRR